jgi:hypothetical protein
MSASAFEAASLVQRRQKAARWSASEICLGQKGSHCNPMSCLGRPPWLKALLLHLLPHPAPLRSHHLQVRLGRCCGIQCSFVGVLRLLPAATVACRCANAEMMLVCCAGNTPSLRVVQIETAIQAVRCALHSTSMPLHSQLRRQPRVIGAGSGGGVERQRAGSD